MFFFSGPYNVICKSVFLTYTFAPPNFSAQNARTDFFWKDPVFEYCGRRQSAKTGSERMNGMRGRCVWIFSKFWQTFNSIKWSVQEIWLIKAFPATAVAGGGVKGLIIPFFSFWVNACGAHCSSVQPSATQYHFVIILLNGVAEKTLRMHVGEVL